MAWINIGIFAPNSYYNYMDFNNVENNTAYLQNLFSLYGYNTTLGAVITSRTMATLDFYDSLNRIEQNIQLLYNALGIVYPGWATKITWSYDQQFMYTDANRFANNLNILNNAITGTAALYEYCSAPNAICGAGIEYV